jgi:hypothetical protein
LTNHSKNEIIDYNPNPRRKMNGIVIEGLELVGSFGVDSGQAMVGDPCYLDQWKTNEGEEWNLEGKVGEYSYQGASATTIANDVGVLGHGTAVVFNTGYGDGVYPVYAQFDEDGRVAKIVIDFIGDEE